MNSKQKWTSVLTGAFVGICLFIMLGVSTASATDVTTHVRNIDPNPHVKEYEDAWYGILDSTSLSIAVYDSWGGGAWNVFDIWFETASDTWEIFDGGAYTYTDLHYDEYSTPDTLQATLSGAGSGGKYVVTARDIKGF